ncbi:MAG: hypothetical protein ISEC1_P1261 [Thiomicrorhabdus sp.]|nr:MAG: hypothetical protein ISEC1_P1261 [Thiomicrorhabdus sp.]
MKILPLILIVSFACFNSTAYAERKTSKEIYAEIMKKRLASKKLESPQCRQARESAKLKYKDINDLIVVTKAEYRKHSEEIGIKDMFRVVKILVKFRVNVDKVTKAICEKKN